MAYREINTKFIRRKTYLLLLFLLILTALLLATPAYSSEDSDLSPAKTYYIGPFIDGHGHLGGEFDVDEMISRNKQDNIPKMVIFPRLHPAGPSPETSEEAASELVAKHNDMFWVTVGLQRWDLYDMDWNDPDSWFIDWLQWAREEIKSQRRRGLGELTARHYAYTDSEYAERDFPIDSKVVDALLKISAETQRPLVLHAEGEEHVVKAIKTQLKRHPDALLVWAHACGRSDPALIDKMMAQYKNLYCDFSNMTDTGHYGSGWPHSGDHTVLWEEEGEIKPEWIAVMEKYHDRFFLGIDSNQWRHYEFQGQRSRVGRVERTRDLLPQLSAKARKSIAMDVATKLFGDRKK